MTPRRIILLFILLEAIIVAGAVVADGFSVAALQTTTRFSARLCLLLFSAIFLLYNKPNIIHAWLSQNYYLLFAIVCGINLAEYLLLFPSLNPPLIYYRIAGGVLAYAFIFSMPLVKTYSITGRISIQQFFIIETVFLYFIWLVFFLTYLPVVQGKLKSVEGSYAESVASLGWLSTMMGIKLTSLIQFKKAK
ncbi:MAG: hypothetical protein C0490_08860 [Marivirga sp.]|nr:hypothetical protein [Marivirga sp.]